MCQRCQELQIKLIRINFIRMNFIRILRLRMVEIDELTKNRVVK